MPAQLHLGALLIQHGSNRMLEHLWSDAASRVSLKVHVVGRPGNQTANNAVRGPFLFLLCSALCSSPLEFSARRISPAC